MKVGIITPNKTFGFADFQRFPPRPPNSKPRYVCRICDILQLWLWSSWIGERCATFFTSTSVSFPAPPADRNRRAWLLGSSSAYEMSRQITLWTSFHPSSGGRTMPNIYHGPVSFSRVNVASSRKEGLIWIYVSIVCIVISAFNVTSPQPSLCTCRHGQSNCLKWCQIRNIEIAENWWWKHRRPELC